MNDNQGTQAQTKTVKPATERQIDFLIRRTRISPEEAGKLSAKAAFTLIASFVKRRRDTERLPPTEAQLRFLEAHDFNRVALGVRTRGHCSRLVYAIKTGRVAS